MAEEEEKKEEEKFEFTPEGETLGYISLDQARILAMRTARETPCAYGRRFRNVPMAFEVTAQEETEDHYAVTFSFRPEGEFTGTPGQEQFFIDKTGTLEVRQVLDLPRPERARRFPLIPVGIGLAIVAAAVVGVVLAAGGLGGNGAEEPVVAAAAPTATPIGVASPTSTPTATSTTALTPTATVVPTTAPAPTATAVPTTAPTPTATGAPTATPEPPPTSTRATRATPGSLTVSAHMQNFRHQDLTFQAGTTVVWTNRDPVQHTVTSGSPSDPDAGSLFDSGSNQADWVVQGETYSFTFNQGGVFPYYCRIHGASMSGTITVQPAAMPPTIAPAPAPTTTPTPEPLAAATATPPPVSDSSDLTADAVIQGFAHQDLTVQTGTTVVWTNLDGASHTSTANEGQWNSGTLRGGETFSFTFAEAGVFSYFCAIHPFMTAVITVNN